MTPEVKIKHAFLLAAGLGTRMENHTIHVPKPLLKIGGVPLIVYSLYTLKQLGIEKVIINTHYLAEQIQSFLENATRKLPFSISISHETRILGTAGGIKKAIMENMLPQDQNFYLLNTDIILEPVAAKINPKLSPETLSFLYMKKKSTGNRETGWDLSETQAHINSDRGEYYYIGFSIINPVLFSRVLPYQVTELGPLWIEASKNNQLNGGIYPGEVVSCGNKSEYENMNNPLPVLMQNDPEFIEFCKLF